jgi:hypothetical protein
VLWPADAIAWHPVFETQLAPDTLLSSPEAQASTSHANAQTTMIQGYPSGTPKLDTFDERVTMPTNNLHLEAKVEFTASDKGNLHSASEVSEIAQRAHVEKT